MAKGVALKGRSGGVRDLSMLRRMLHRHALAAGMAREGNKGKIDHRIRIDIFWNGLLLKCSKYKFRVWMVRQIS